MARYTAAKRRALTKARRKWMSMSARERKRRMPGRPYKVHTVKWHRLVKKLRRRPGIKTPEALATFVLGRKGYAAGARRRYRY